MSEFKKYDFIIAGAGCAGLSLLVHLIRSQQFNQHQILLVDKDPKTRNDRTWCFWEKQAGPFESIVYQRWDKAWFKSNSLQQLMDLSPYQYKLIRGSDFYTSCFELIRRQPNIDVRFETVEAVNADDEAAYVIVNGQRINAGYVFNSIIFEQPVMNKKEYLLLQHFRGWVVNSTREAFVPGEAVLMDFRVPQVNGTSFVYVMPFSAYQALVEYTVFSGKLLEDEQYESALLDYLANQLHIEDYSILEKEAGVIPMTNYSFPLSNQQVINIGTAGGQSKASSGYTFQFIQKHSAAIVQLLLQKKKPVVKPANSRFRFYDSVLLHILEKGKLPGHEIFSAFFRNNSPQQIFRFLDNESTVADELKIISSLPTWPFMKAAIRQVF